MTSPYKTSGFENFSEFWPFYINEHAVASNRALHYLGTSLFIASLCAYAYTMQLQFLYAGPIMAYSCAWFGHFFIEKNRPATFKYPFYSLMGDFKMCFLFWTMQIDAELKIQLPRKAQPNKKTS